MSKFLRKMSVSEFVKNETMNDVELVPKTDKFHAFLTFTSSKTKERSTVMIAHDNLSPAKPVIWEMQADADDAEKYGRTEGEKYWMYCDDSASRAVSATGVVAGF